MCGNWPKYGGEALEAYYELQLEKERRKVSASTIDTLSAHRERAESLRGAGEVPEVDVLRAEAELDRARAELVRAEGEIEQARLRLAAVVGLDLKAELQLREDDLAAPSSVDLDLQEDLARVRELDPGVSAARGEVAEAVTELELFVDHRGGYTRRRSYRERELAVEQAKHELRTANRRVELEVRSVHAEIAAALSIRDAVGRQVEPAERAEEMAMLQYEAGLVPITAVLDASLAHREIRMSAAEAEINCLLILTRRGVLLGQGAVEHAEEDYREASENIGRLK